jgi:excisionase family DNA binding protein
VDKLLTVKDVADYLQMSKEKVYKLAQRGKIPVSRIENQWRFRLEKVDAWLEANEMSSIAVAAQEVIALQIPSHAEPFLKWEGGKGQLLKKYEAFFPAILIISLSLLLVAVLCFFISSTLGGYKTERKYS